MRRLSRSILVLSIVAALNVPATYGRPLKDDQDPRARGPRIVKLIKQIVVKLIGKPDDDGGELLPPKP
jgi:hypothetical protein